MSPQPTRHVLLACAVAAAASWFAGLEVSGVAALLYVVVLSTVSGYDAWTWLLKNDPASRVAPVTLLVPVVGILSAWVALEETPNVAELCGAAVVLVGLALTMRALRPPRRVEVALT